MPRTSLALTVVLSLLVAAPARPTPPQAAPPVFGAEVSLVLLPVFVVGNDGRAVRGLQPEDFSVEADGEPAELVSFRYVDTTERDEQPELRQTSAARRRFLLVFDKSFTDLAGLNRAQRAAAAFVRERLAESDLVGVMTFDVQRGLRLVANFSEDRVLAAHAIETLGVPQLSHISDPLGLATDLAVTDLALTGPGADPTSPGAAPLLDNVLSVLVRQMRSAEMEQYRTHVATLVGSLADLARGLQRVDGRKQVLYFSAGFDSRLLTGQEGSEQRASSLSIAEGRIWEVDATSRYGDSRVRGELDAATRALARADAVVHTVDVTGLAGEDALDQVRPGLDSTRSIPGRESLNLVASNTGGRFFRDANDLGSVLSEMLEMTSRYYVLGIQPRETRGPGTYHKVKVRVARKSVKLSHRPGYYERDLPSASRTVLQRQFEAAQLVMTGGGDDDLRFSSLCLPFPEPEGRQTLGLVVQVPKESLAWHAGQSTALEIYAYATAEDGRAVDHLAEFTRLDPGQLEPGDAARGVSFYGSLSVPPGQYTLRLMVHDRTRGVSGVQLLDVAVPRYDPAVGFLLPPVVVDDASRWLRVEMGRAKESRRPYPFQLEGEPYLPRASFAVSGGAAERLVLLAYEPAVAGDPAADVQIWSSLTSRAGEPRAPGLLRVERVLRDARGLRTYVLGYTPEAALAQGDYTLRVGVGEAGALLESYALIRVRPES